MAVDRYRLDVCMIQYPEESEALESKLQELIAEQGITHEEVEEIIKTPALVAASLEKLTKSGRVPKHEVLSWLASYYHLPFIEFDEGFIATQDILHQLNLDQLKEGLWFPISVQNRTALVVASDPHGPRLRQEITEALDVDNVKFCVALPSDIRRIVEHNQDVNPNFPGFAGRTPLAKLRTWLADHRTLLAQYRTVLAEGRTGLAFIRTGVSFIAIGLVLMRIFGLGYISILEGLLLVIGFVMTIDGLMWHLPTRKIRNLPLGFNGTEPTFGTTILAGTPSDNEPVVTRTQPIEGADELRARWNRLSPVMKRRFLASDRTDLAEERTVLAAYRTLMARSRTGLAFTRTGVSFMGLGIALLRQFPGGIWEFFFGALVVLGLGMMLEGLHWYVPGRRAGKESFDAVQRVQKKTSIWDFMFRPFHKHLSPDDLPPTLVIKGSHAPGIWGTTGLALERTLIADRRNLKSRLRTIMARSRTGMAFIRTGSSILSVGLGLMMYFGFGNALWTLFNVLLILIGIVLITDGFYWHIPAERTRKHFPYCFGDMEIVMPDYARPAPQWKKVVFGYEDL